MVSWFKMMMVQSLISQSDDGPKAGKSKWWWSKGREAFGFDPFSECDEGCGFGMLVTLDDFILWFAELGSMRPTSDLYLVNLTRVGHTSPRVQEPDLTPYDAFEKSRNNTKGFVGITGVNEGCCLLCTWNPGLALLPGECWVVLQVIAYLSLSSGK